MPREKVEYVEGTGKGGYGGYGVGGHELRVV